MSKPPMSHLSHCLWTVLPALPVFLSPFQHILSCWLSFLFSPVHTSVSPGSFQLLTVTTHHSVIYKHPNPWRLLSSNANALSSHMSCTILTNFSATPDLLKQQHSSSLHTLLYTFSKSAKTRCSSFWPSLYISINTTKQNHIIVWYDFGMIHFVEYMCNHTKHETSCRFLLPVCPQHTIHAL